MFAHTHSVFRFRALALMFIGAAATVVLATTLAMQQGNDRSSGTFGDETLFSSEMRGAADAFWWTIASGGTFDNSASGKYVTKNGTVTIPNSAGDNAKVIVRYNIVGLPNLVGTPSVRWDFAFRYRDNGPNARVIVRLKRYNLFDGSITVLNTFDSNSFAQQNGWQQRVIQVNRNDFTFDWANNAYFFEVIINKTGSGGNPALGIIALAGVD